MQLAGNEPMSFCPQCMCAGIAALAQACQLLLQPILGVSIPTNISNMMENSQAAIFVLSRHYIRSDYGSLEFKEAGSRYKPEGNLSTTNVY